MARAFPATQPSACRGEMDNSAVCVDVHGAILALAPSPERIWTVSLATRGEREREGKKLSGVIC